MTKRRSTSPEKQKLPQPLPARDRLLDAAELLFADRGYYGVSLRDIANAANVRFGVIPYYFGTKEKLFEEVYRRLVEPINEERRRNLAQIRLDAGQNSPDIMKALEAALAPMFKRSRMSENYRRLAGRSATDPAPEVRQVLKKVFPRGNVNLHQLLRQACPHLSEKEFWWRFFCFHGAVYYVLADVGRIQEIAGAKFKTSDPEVALKFVIPYFAAGWMAPAVELPISESRPAKRQSPKVKGK